MTTVQEALESPDPHPNGTRWFSALSTDALRLERVASLPAALNGKPDQVAAYDERAEVLYVVEGVDDEVVREVTLAVGSVLTLR